MIVSGDRVFKCGHKIRVITKRTVALKDLPFSTPFFHSHDKSGMHQCESDTCSGGEYAGKGNVKEDL